MTAKEREYRLNAQKCKAYGNFLEVLTRELKTPLKKELTKLSLIDVKYDLGVLWDRQISLFFEIETERKAAEKATLDGKIHLFF